MSDDEKHIELALRIIQTIEAGYHIIENGNVTVSAYLAGDLFTVVCRVYDHVTQLQFDINDTMLLGLDFAVEHTIDTLLEVTDRLKYPPKSAFEDFINSLDMD